jgi:hypothetical protein
MSTRDQLIGTDAALTSLQRRALDCVLNLIVPPSEDGRLPGAMEVGVPRYLLEVEPASLPVLRDELDRLEAHAQLRFGAAFADLDASARQRLVDSLRTDDPQFLRALALHTVTCYYQHDRVLAAIGMEPRAPYPQGYEVKSGDLSLLDPVRRRGRIWRDAGDSTAGPASRSANEPPQ